MRAYRQNIRAQRVEENEARILEAAERLFSTVLFDRVTLDAIAREAGVTIPTLQRRFGSKEGILTAVGEKVRARVGRQRGTPPAGDLRAAIRQLVEHYELEGRLVWHLLRQEDDSPALAAALDEGRATHRRWVAVAFEPVISARPAAERRALIDALVAATDLFVWKLLRLDLGRGRAQVEKTILTMVEAIVRGNT